MLLCSHIFPNESIKPDLSTFSSLGAKWEKNDNGILQQEKRWVFFPRFALLINEDLFENCLRGSLSLLSLNSQLASPKVNTVREQKGQTNGWKFFLNFSMLSVINLCMFTFACYKLHSVIASRPLTCLFFHRTSKKIFLLINFLSDLLASNMHSYLFSMWTNIHGFYLITRWKTSLIKHQLLTSLHFPRRYSQLNS